MAYKIYLKFFQKIKEYFMEKVSPLDSSQHGKLI
jgi:hypothetical protein